MSARASIVSSRRTVTCIIALLFAAPSSAFAGVEFAPPVSYALRVPASSVVLGDLDGDGDLDAAVGTGAHATVAVFLNRGDGTYGPAPEIESFAHADLEIANLDGDATPDLAVAGAGVVKMYRGLGGGTFAFALDIPTGVTASAIAAADLDGDGDTDFAVSGYTDRAVAVVLNLGGSFSTPVRHGLPGPPRSIEAGDLDGDGRADLVTGNYSGSASVLLGRGNGSFDPAVSHEAHGLISCARIADLNGDGDPDLAVADEAGSINVLVNRGRPGFAFVGNTLLYGRARAGAAADFDGDGNADVAVARDDLGQVIVLAGRGDGGFLFPALYFAAGMGARDVACGDVNRDGRKDLVTADAGSGGGGSMSVLIGGKPRTCRRDDLPSGIGASGLVAGDFNADGAVDLASTNEDNTLSVFLNEGTGTLARDRQYPLGTLSQNVATGDLDGDSRPDLVASDYVESAVTLYMNLGDGRFHPAGIVRVGPHPRWVEIADMDGDGRPDLVTANYNDAIHAGSITVLFNRGNRRFADPVHYAVGVGPYMVRAAHLNRDEMPDLVVNNYDGQSVSVLLNMGDGSLAPEARYPAGWNLSSAVADFDRDGDNDVAVTNFKENTVTVLRNDGSGVLAWHADIPVGRNPRSIQAAVVKGDGDVDLAVALAGQSQVTLLENEGGGLFTAVSLMCGVGVNPKTLIVADFDGNGGQDLATANTGAGTVSVLLDVSPAGSVRSRGFGQRRPQNLAADDRPARFALGAIRPNPAPGAATFSFEIPRETRVELRIYDVAGRVVKTVVDGTLPAGEHEARWEGTSDRGERASPGTYFCRLRAGDQRAVRALILH